VPDVAAPLPSAAAVAFTFVGTLHSYVTHTPDGHCVFSVEWSIVRFQATPTGGIGGGGAASTPVRFVDRVEFGVRLLHADRGWAVDEVAPTRTAETTLLTGRVPDVAVGAGPNGANVARGVPREWETTRHPWSLAAHPAADDSAADATWRWERRGLDDGSPYYADAPTSSFGRWLGGRGGGGGGGGVTGGGVGGGRVDGPLAPSVVTMSHVVGAGAARAAWGIPASALAAAELRFEVTATPRVVALRRVRRGTGHRLFLSHTAVLQTDRTRYAQTFSVPLSTH